MIQIDLNCFVYLGNVLLFIFQSDYETGQLVLFNCIERRTVAQI